MAREQRKPKQPKKPQVNPQAEIEETKAPEATTEPKELVVLRDQMPDPRMGPAVTEKAMGLIRRLRYGEILVKPQAKTIKVKRDLCYYLRLSDKNCIWRVFYRIDPDVIVIIHVLQKKTQKIPPSSINTCEQRLKEYDARVAAWEAAQEDD